MHGTKWANLNMKILLNNTFTTALVFTVLEIIMANSSFAKLNKDQERAINNNLGNITLLINNTIKELDKEGDPDILISSPKMEGLKARIVKFLENSIQDSKSSSKDLEFALKEIQKKVKASHETAEKLKVQFEQAIKKTPKNIIEDIENQRTFKLIKNSESELSEAIRTYDSAIELAKEDGTFNTKKRASIKKAEDGFPKFAKALVSFTLGQHFYNARIKPQGLASVPKPNTQTSNLTPSASAPLVTIRKPTSQTKRNSVTRPFVPMNTKDAVASQGAPNGATQLRSQSSRATGSVSSADSSHAGEETKTSRSLSLTNANPPPPPLIPPSRSQIALPPLPPAPPAAPQNQVSEQILAQPPNLNPSSDTRRLPPVRAIQSSNSSSDSNLSTHVQREEVQTPSSPPFSSSRQVSPLNNSLSASPAHRGTNSPSRSSSSGTSSDKDLSQSESDPISERSSIQELGVQTPSSLPFSSSRQVSPLNNSLSASPAHSAYSTSRSRSSSTSSDRDVSQSESDPINDYLEAISKVAANKTPDSKKHLDRAAKDATASTTSLWLKSLPVNQQTGELPNKAEWYRLNLKMKNSLTQNKNVFNSYANLVDEYSKVINPPSSPNSPAVTAELLLSKKARDCGKNLTPKTYLAMINQFKAAIGNATSQLPDDDVTKKELDKAAQAIVSAATAWAKNPDNENLGLAVHSAYQALLVIYSSLSQVPTDLDSCSPTPMNEANDSAEKLVRKLSTLNHPSGLDPAHCSGDLYISDPEDEDPKTQVQSKPKQRRSASTTIHRRMPRSIPGSDKNLISAPALQRSVEDPRSSTQNPGKASEKPPEQKMDLSVQPVSNPNTAPNPHALPHPPLGLDTELIVH